VGVPIEIAGNSRYSNRVRHGEVLQHSILETLANPEYSNFITEPADLFSRSKKRAMLKHWECVKWTSCQRPRLIGPREIILTQLKLVTHSNSNKRMNVVAFMG
jgi:hypothetical protein